MRQQLSAEHVEIADESAAHAGHAGAAQGGGHFALTVVSPRFRGLNQIQRHRLVYEALGDLMQTQIHALSIRALAPGEN
jgi:BolA family transcriptional regulator, general stress-responsive regulator